MRTLLTFNTPLRCLDLNAPLWMDDDGLRAVAADLAIGDMRQPESLLLAEVRSNGSRSLERHLRERLPGVVMVDPELLTAGVFAHALHREGGEAAFADQAERFQVYRQEISVDSQEDLHTLQNRQRRLLQWCPADQICLGPPASQWWDLGGKPRARDQWFWLEAVSTPLSRARRGRNGWSEAVSSLQSPGKHFKKPLSKP